MSDESTILIVEDDDAIAQMVIDHLQSSVKARVVRTRNATETIRLDLEQPPDLMITDILLPDGNGLDLIKLVRTTRTYPVLVMTGQPTLSRAVEALRMGVADLLTKPFDLQRLTCVVKESLAKYEKQQRSQRRLERLEELTRKVVAERKSLQERVDLVCKDLVGAYRDLAEKFVRGQGY